MQKPGEAWQSKTAGRVQAEGSRRQAPTLRVTLLRRGGAWQNQPEEQEKYAYQA